MNINPIILSIPIYFLLIGIEVVYDLFKKKGIYRLNDSLTNISCGMFEQITGVFAKVGTIAIYHYVYVNFAVFSIPETWYWAIFLFIAVDFFYYWAHRLDHEVNILWLGHVVHHQSEDYNFSVALRQGAFQKVFNVVFMLPLALAGFETEWFLYIGAFTTLYQFWIHTETIEKLPRWFEYIFNTPSHHRVHHGRNPKYIDRNHGGTFIIFDRLFGTFQPEEERPTYGVTTPTATFDPITAHAKPWKALWNQMKQVNGFSNKVKLLIMPPGWLPAEMGGRMAPPEIEENYHKFDLRLPNKWNFYLLFQYAIIIGSTAFFLFNFNQFETRDALLMACLITLSLLTIGRIFEQKKWIFWLEIARLTLISSLLLSIYSFSPTLNTIIVMLTCLSVIWVISNAKATLLTTAITTHHESAK